MKIDIAGVLVDNITNSESVKKIDEFVMSGRPHYIVTPYSEMIVFAQNDPRYRDILNHAALSLPDGIGILRAAKYLGSEIRERVTGRKLIYDIAKLSEAKGYSIAMVGGHDNVAQLAAAALKKQFPNLKINLAISDRPFDDKILAEINDSKSDILLIGYSPPKQEIWLAQNISKLGVKVGIGLGGTFDYLAGKRFTPPNLVHYMGLEWLWRLVTQPWRIGRMWNAVPVFIWTVYKYKINHERNTN